VIDGGVWPRVHLPGARDANQRSWERGTLTSAHDVGINRIDLRTKRRMGVWWGRSPTIRRSLART